MISQKVQMLKRLNKLHVRGKITLLATEYDLVVLVGGTAFA